MSGAIDKLEIQAPQRSYWTDQVLSACARPDRANEALLRKQGGQYRRAIDLRRYGLSSVLYLESRATGSDKLVLYHVGDMSFAQMINEISSTFCGDVLDLRVMRIDLAVDVAGYSVGFFRDHSYVTRKRRYGEIGPRYESSICKIETLTYGKRPNVIRIYNKHAQRAAEDRSWRRPPSYLRYEQRSSLIPLTRVERQYGGGQIPAQLVNIRSVRDAALNINPFECLEFSSAVDFTNDLAGLTARRYVKVLGIQTMISKLGYQKTLLELNRRPGGEGRKVLLEFERLVPQHKLKDPPDLYAMYQESLRKQFGSAA